MTSWTRRSVALAGCAAPFFVSSIAYANAGAERFVAQIGAETLRLSQTSAAAGAYRALLERTADLDRIANVVLGRSGRTFTPDQKARFRIAFANLLSTRVRNAVSGVKSFTVGASVEARAGDIVVTSQAERTSGEPLTLRWRVMTTNKGQRLVDVEVAGVFLAFQQQAEYAAFLDKNNGDANALIAFVTEAAERGAAA